MADRQFTCRVARPAEVPPAMVDVAIKWERLADKWRDLAERRSAHHVEMFYSGRWRHYYTEAEFMAVMRSSILVARRWSAIAPGVPDQPAAVAQPEQPEQYQAKAA